MSGRVIRKVRSRDYYRHLLTALSDFGISDFEIVSPTGRGHPILRFRYGGGEHRIPLPGSPRAGSRAQDYLRCEIKRRIGRRGEGRAGHMAG